MNSLLQFPHISQTSQNWREIKLWIRLWFKGLLWLVWSSIQTTKTFFISATKLFHFLIIHVFTGGALLISFRNLFFAFTIWLAVWCMRPIFQPISAFSMPSSPSLIILSFWFKVRDTKLFPLLEHLEAAIGLLTGLISVPLCYREWEVQEAGEILANGHRVE